MLVIHHPPSYVEERNYIYAVIFGEFLGISYHTVIEDRQDVCISDGDTANKVIVADVFFQTPQQKWLTHDSLPKQPLNVWTIEQPELREKLVCEQIPIIFGQSKVESKHLEILIPSPHKQEITLAIDIFGSAFFMLTRYEEIVKAIRDSYDRFPANFSLAFQEGFLERPIINEYIEILWWTINKLWPQLKRKERKFRIIPTHDVDRPFSFLFSTPYMLIRTLAGDLLKKHDITTFIKRAGKVYDCRVKKDVLQDENYTFDLIMDISEKYNLTSTFYMMTAHGLSAMDGNYPLNNPYIIDLIKTIRSRGHNIGLHPSFVSYLNGCQIQREVQHLQSVCLNAGVDLPQTGGRQHCLRWQSPDTWQHYEDAGLTYDTTLNYADNIGFRCGVCYEYTVFNLKSKQHLKLKERPLIVMECTALDERYMKLSYEESFKRIAILKILCKKYEGDFVILWHNNRFIDEAELNLYENIIKY